MKASDLMIKKAVKTAKTYHNKKKDWTCLQLLSEGFTLAASSADFKESGHLIKTATSVKVQVFENSNGSICIILEK